MKKVNVAQELSTALLRSSSRELEGGFTIRDLVRVNGRTRVFWRGRVQEAIATGIVTLYGQRHEFRIDGQRGLVPVYKLTKKEKKDARGDNV